GTHCTIEFDRVKAEIRLAADDAFRMGSLVDVLTTKLTKRGVPLKNLEVGEDIPGAGESVRRVATLKQAIDKESAKAIVKAIKDQGFKKVQGSIQGDEVRVSGPSRDDLQAVIAFLRGQDFGVELKFGNFRS
ncbi:MAG: DUF520 family protein, partial [Gemmatimonadales bacterium]